VTSNQKQRYIASWGRKGLILLIFEVIDIAFIEMMKFKFPHQFPFYF